MEKGPFDAAGSCLVLVPTEPYSDQRHSRNPATTPPDRPRASGGSHEYWGNGVCGDRSGRTVTSILCEFSSDSLYSAAVGGSIAGLVAVVCSGSPGSGCLDCRYSSVGAPRSDGRTSGLDWFIH